MALKKINYTGSSKVIIRLCEMVNQLIDGGGGDSVSYTQTLSNGTETGEITINGTTTKMYAPTQPTKLSDLTNDEGFITNTVNNLANYYLKSETYTQAEVNSLIGAITTLNILVVQTLPTQDISTTTIYLVPKQTAGTQDVYDEFLYVNNAWEHIGTTEIDLSNYYTKTQVDTLLADKVDKVTGKGLSAEDYTTAEKTKLSGISDSADAVSWTQVVGSGTKIAEITINGTTVDVYAPNGGSTYTEGDGIDITNTTISVDTAFTEASTRTNIASGDTFATILGKIKKFFTDLKTVAFTGSYSDLSDKPTIPDISTKVSKSGDTMTGNLILKGTNSALELNLLIEASGGMAIGGNTLKPQEDSAGTVYTNTLPSKNGKLAVVGDIPTDFVSKANGGTFNGGVVIVVSGGEGALTLGGAASNTTGALYIYAGGSRYSKIITSATGSSHTNTLPNKDGTFAMTDDILPKYGNKTLLGTITPSNTGATLTPTKQGFVVLCANMTTSAQNIKGRIRDGYDPYFGTSFNVTINAYAGEPICFIPCRANAPLAIEISGHTVDVSVYLY